MDLPAPSGLTPRDIRLRNGRAGVLVFVVILLMTAPLSGDCPRSSVDARSVIALAESPDLASLDEAINRIGAKDAALAAVYRRRRLALHSSDREEVRYLKSLPKNESELNRIYELTYTRDVCEHPIVSATVYEMFDTAAHLIREHGRFHRPFIELCALTDGEVAESAWPAFDWLLENDAARTVAALRSLPVASRTRICGGSDPRHLNLKDAIARCRSEV